MYLQQFKQVCETNQSVNVIPHSNQTRHRIVAVESALTLANLHFSSSTMQVVPFNCTLQEPATNSVTPKTVECCPRVRRSKQISVHLKFPLFMCLNVVPEDDRLTLSPYQFLAAIFDKREHLYTAPTDLNSFRVFIDTYLRIVSEPGAQ